MRKTTTALLLPTLLLVSCLSRENVDVLFFEKATLFGMIYDEDSQPCSGATISIDGKDGPITDIRGRFVVPDLSRGEHTLVAKKAGYEELSLTFGFLNKTDVLYLKVISFSQLLQKAERALQERKWEDADALLARAEKLGPEDTVYLYLRAIEAYKTGKFPEAVEILNGIIGKGVKEPYVYLFLADIYQNDLKESEKAIENLEAYLAKRADSDIEKRLQGLRGK